MLFRSKSTQILNTQKQTDKDTHERTVTTIVKEPTGKTVTRTVTTKDTETRTDADINKTTQTETETHPIRKPLNISAIIAIDHLKPAYGLSVTKEIWGPITVGAFGLSTGVIGVTIGLDF